MASQAILFVKDKNKIYGILTALDGKPNDILPKLKKVDVKELIKLKQIRSISDDGSLEQGKSPAYIDIYNNKKDALKDKEVARYAYYYDKDWKQIKMKTLKEFIKG